MALLNLADIQRMIEEIQGEAEETRRAFMSRRHKIYRNGGKEYLVEDLEKEFDKSAIKEMRLVNLNTFKRIVDKRGAIYKRAPLRLASSGGKANKKDQALVDHYSQELSINELMDKGNRYLVAFANCVAYPIMKIGEDGLGKIDAKIVPPYLYSLVPNKFEKTIIDKIIFSAFVEEDNWLDRFEPEASTGREGFNREKGTKSERDLVASNERSMFSHAQKYICWSKQFHFTTNAAGEPIVFNEDLGEEQFLNPFGVIPAVNIARDRDNNIWSDEGQDIVDLTLVINKAASDLFTIAKHQGFSQLVSTGPEEPKLTTMGINRNVHLKAVPGMPTPTMEYLQASSPIGEYKDIILDLIALQLSLASLSPSTVGGRGSAKSFTSGFQALIEHADNFEAIERDKPIMLSAEKDLWEIIKVMHNLMLDNNQLTQEARALGKFSDDFEITVHYADMKPIESDAEKLRDIKELMGLGLITRRDALKKLNPDLQDDQIDEKLQQIQDEKTENVKRMQSAMGVSNEGDSDGSETSEDRPEPASGDQNFGSRKENRSSE